jgi:hypothetical protein
VSYIADLQHFMDKVVDSFATFFVSFRGQKGAKIGLKLSNSLPNEIANPPGFKSSKWRPQNKRESPLFSKFSLFISG